MRLPTVAFAFVVLLGGAPAVDASAKDAQRFADLMFAGVGVVVVECAEMDTEKFAKVDMALVCAESDTSFNIFKSLWDLNVLKLRDEIPEPVVVKPWTRQEDGVHFRVYLIETTMVSVLHSEDGTVAVAYDMPGGAAPPEGQ